VPVSIGKSAIIPRCISWCIPQWHAGWISPRRAVLAAALVGALLAAAAPLAAADASSGHSVTGLSDSAADAAQAKIRDELIAARIGRTALESQITSLVDQRDALAAALILALVIGGAYLGLRRAAPAPAPRARSSAGAPPSARAPAPRMPAPAKQQPQPALASAGGDKARR
jgi:hypothetical protein